MVDRDRKPSQAEQDLHRAAREVSGGETENVRRMGIVKLATSLLKTLNHKLEPEVINDYFLSRGNLFSDTPLHELRREERPEKEHLEGYDDALAITRFYFENPDVVVPTRLEYRTGFYNLEDSVKPGEKVLFFIDEKRTYYGENSPEVDIEFKIGRNRGVFKKKTEELELPDVYLKNIESGAGNRERQFFGLKGVSNLLIGGEIKPAGNGMQVELTAENKCVVLPGAKIIAKDGKTMLYGPALRIALNVPNGEIVQYPDSEVRVQDILCGNYIQEGGEIGTPGSDQVVIECSGSFMPNGGTRPDEPFLLIKDQSYLDRLEASKVRDQIIANEAGIPLDDETTQEDEAGKLTPEAEFDRGYQPTIEIKNPDDGSVTRGYNLAAEPSGIGEFNARAVAAGWKIANEVQVGTIMVVTLNKPKSE